MRSVVIWLWLIRHNYTTQYTTHEIGLTRFHLNVKPFFNVTAPTQIYTTNDTIQNASNMYKVTAAMLPPCYDVYRSYRGHGQPTSKFYIPI